MAEKILSRVLSLSPGTKVELFELDTRRYQGGAILRFHPYRQSDSIWWQGEEYSPFPVQVTGFSQKGGEEPETPTLQVADPDGVISTLCYQFEDLLGCRLVRHVTLAEFLDARNFNQRETLMGSMALAGQTVTLTSQTGPVVDINTVKTLEITDVLGVHDLSPNLRYNRIKWSSPEAEGQWRANSQATLQFNHGTAPTQEPTTYMEALSLSSNAYAYESISVSYTAGTDYVASLYVRVDPTKTYPSGSTIAWRLHTNVFGRSVSVIVDLASKTVTASGDPARFGHDDLGDGWLRIWVSARATASQTTWAPLIYLRVPAGEGIEFFGAQLEVGLEPTRYIRTLGAVGAVVDYSVDDADLHLGEMPYEGSTLTYEVLASVNIGNPNADPNEHFRPNVLFINRKTNQSAGELVEFELTTILKRGISGGIPNRTIMANVCAWSRIGQYRGPQCGYNGTKYFDRDNNPVPSRDQDVCNYLVSGCTVRNGDNPDGLPYGSFPMAGLTRLYA